MPSYRRSLSVAFPPFALALALGNMVGCGASEGAAGVDASTTGPDATIEWQSDASAPDASSRDAAVDSGPACSLTAAPTVTCTSYARTAAPTSVQPTASSEWQSLTIDRAGEAHALLMTVLPGLGARLEYVHGKGTFAVERIDEIAPGTNGVNLIDGQLVVDSCGRPTVVYQVVDGVDRSKRRIFVAQRKAAAWSVEPLALPAIAEVPVPRSLAASLTVDAAGEPIVFTAIEGAVASVVSRRSGSTWTHERLPSADIAPNDFWHGGWAYAAYSPSRGVVLAFNAGRGLYPALAWKSGGAWVVKRVAGALGLTSPGDRSMAVAVGADDRVHLVWRHEFRFNDGAVTRDRTDVSYAALDATGAFSTPVVVDQKDSAGIREVDWMGWNRLSVGASADNRPSVAIHSMVYHANTAGELVKAPAPPSGENTHATTAFDTSGRSLTLLLGSSDPRRTDRITETCP